MDEEILTVHAPIVSDESIAHVEIHSHQPYASSTFSNNDEVRITVQNQDLCSLPSKSSLRISGRITKPNNTTVPALTKLVNNGICFLLEEVRYELNGVEIDRCKSVGITTLLKGYASLSPSQSNSLENAGWFDLKETGKQTDASGYFDVSIPLKLLLGLCEDYTKIVVNAKHELVLTRANTDNDAVYSETNHVDGTSEAFKITISRVDWLVPYVRASDKRKIPLYNAITMDKSVTMGFRTWEMFVYPTLPQTSKHVWTVKTSSQLEKPRYVILGFQTDRQNRAVANATHFDHCDLRNVTLFLNSQSYPYGQLNLDIAHNQYAPLYDMYVSFQSLYYGKEAEPMLSKSNFLTHAPIIIIDCSRQNESIKSGPVDVRLELESHNNFPANTTAYCLILHDRVVQYSPLSGTVSKQL